jgi:hypothetical protein
VSVKRAHLFRVVSYQFHHRGLRNPGIFEQADRRMAKAVKAQLTSASFRVPANSAPFVCLFFAQTSWANRPTN